MPDAHEVDIARIVTDRLEIMDGLLLAVQHRVEVAELRQRRDELRVHRDELRAGGAAAQ